jgi:hypothetical protein
MNPGTAVKIPTAITQYPVTTIKPNSIAKNDPTRRRAEYGASFDLIVLTAGLDNRFIEVILSVSFQ